MFPLLKTERLILRELTEEDARVYYNAFLILMYCAIMAKTVTRC